MSNDTKFEIKFTEDGRLVVDIAYLIQQLPREQQLALARTFSWESEIWAELCRGMLDEYSGENYNNRINELRKLILTSPEAPDIFRRVTEDLMWHLMMARAKESWYVSRVGILQHWHEEHLREAHGLRYGEMPEAVRNQGAAQSIGLHDAYTEVDNLLEHAGLAQAHLEKMREEAYDKLLKQWEDFKARESNVKDGFLVNPFRQYPIGFKADEIDYHFRYYRFAAPTPPRMIPAMRIEEALKCPPGGDDYESLVGRIKAITAGEYSPPKTVSVEEIDDAIQAFECESQTVEQMLRGDRYTTLIERLKELIA